MVHILSDEDVSRHAKIPAKQIYACPSSFVNQMIKQAPSSWATSHCPRRSTPSRGSKRCRSTPFVNILLRASRKYFFFCSPFHLAKVQWQVQGSSPQCPELCLIFWGMGGGGYSTTSISNWYIIWIENNLVLKLTWAQPASLQHCLAASPAILGWSIILHIKWNKVLSAQKQRPKKS